MDFSSLNADWIDLVILIVFFFYLLGGYGRGFLLGTVDLFGFIFSLIWRLSLQNFSEQIKQATKEEGIAKIIPE